eukprot:6009004-Pleurochrysis_carterae.AAC.2
MHKLTNLQRVSRALHLRASVVAFCRSCATFESSGSAVRDAEEADGEADGRPDLRRPDDQGERHSHARTAKDGGRQTRRARGGFSWPFLKLPSAQEEEKESGGLGR